MQTNEVSDESYVCEMTSRIRLYDYLVEDCKLAT
jgi:hypothetical protein